MGAVAVQPKRKEGMKEFNFLQVRMIHQYSLWSVENGDYTLLFKVSQVLSSHTFSLNFLDIQ